MVRDLQGLSQSRSDHLLTRSLDGHVHWARVDDVLQAVLVRGGGGGREGGGRGRRRPSLVDGHRNDKVVRGNLQQRPSLNFVQGPLRGGGGESTLKCP